MKKAAIFNPYLDTLGGGERYTVGIARALVDMGYEVDFEWENTQILKKLQDRFGEKLTNISTTQSIERGEGYDICIWISDGSIPLLKAKKNYIHFQVPFKDVHGSSLVNKMKLFRVNDIFCNSNFTKKVIDKEYSTNSKVLYPPVGVEKIKSKKKENMIVAVGRFSRLLQSKRQDVLIDTFRSNKTSFKGWKLVLAGGTEVGGDQYLKELKKSAKNLPITILKSPPHKKILDLYGKAKIFWSASGYGIDDKKEPKFVEHFGITTVEAMAGGAVPIVMKAGGHKEIVKHGVNGYLWKNPDELVKYTSQTISNQKLLNKLKKQAKSNSEKYSYENFKKNFKKIIK